MEKLTESLQHASLQLTTNINSLVVSRLLLVVSLLLLVTLLVCSCEPAKKTEICPKEGDLSGKIVWHGDKDKKAVALTFDDGPNPTYTPQILDILMKYNIKATFFPFGIHAEKNPDIVERIVKEGHEFGNHTYTHASGYIVDGNKLYREIKKADNAIKKITGTSPIFFRPPFGFFNWRYFRTAEKLGYTIVLWSVDAADWYKTDPSKIKERILSRAENGSIILLHDGGKDREEVIKALPAIIDGLKKKGFEITTLSQLLKINPQQKSSPEAVSRNL